jgi:hypothetical protein
MATAQQIIERVSRRLVDHEPGYRYTTWTKRDLLNALNDALGLLAEKKPELFSRLRSYPLPASGVFETDDTLLPPFVLMQTNGKRVRVLSTATDAPDLINVLLVTGAQSSPLYLWDRGAAYEAYPPPYTDGKYTVRATAVVVPRLTLHDIIPVSALWLPVVEEFMLYYACAYDRESASAVAQAKMFLANAYEMLAGR